MSKESFKITVQVIKVFLHLIQASTSGRFSSKSLGRMQQMANICLRFYFHIVGKVFVKQDDSIADTANKIYIATGESETLF